VLPDASSILATSTIGTTPYSLRGKAFFFEIMVLYAPRPDAFWSGLVCFGLGYATFMPQNFHNGPAMVVQADD
jgi:hypothetical protein